MEKLINLTDILKQEKKDETQKVSKAVLMLKLLLLSHRSYLELLCLTKEESVNANLSRWYVFWGAAVFSVPLSSSQGNRTKVKCLHLCNMQLSCTDTRTVQNHA